MKRTFLAGIALLLPVVITLAIVIWLLNLLTAPLSGFVAMVFAYYGILEHSLLLNMISKLLSLGFLFFTILLIGYLANTLTMSYLLFWGGRLIRRIPIINRIYKSFRQAIYSLHQDKEPTFSQVVLVPFPDEGSYTVGLITSHNKMVLHDKTTHTSISVFVPSCPNPTGGLVLTFEPNKVHFLNFKVDEAMKFIISFGSMKPELLQVNPGNFTS